ncbi:hypothetical protein GGR52DRAFT_527945 [Hypoxylon sp. FL1284]|nr:hypothetical protein GGR52DRAFT_527945 [Hypoxylon sp. FL1284]
MKDVLSCLLRVLLDHGCPGVDDEDANGWVPLAWAVQNDVPEIIKEDGAVLGRRLRPRAYHQSASGKGCRCGASEQRR